MLVSLLIYICYFRKEQSFEENYIIHYYFPSFGRPLILSRLHLTKRHNPSSLIDRPP